jgi:ribose-phosphate pyrophosphokinase
MTTLNLLYPEQSNIPYKKMIFPDGQPHLVIEPESLDKKPNEVKIISRISNPADLLLVLFAKNALEYLGVQTINLTITYLMAARMDRVMNPGEPFSLKVVAQLLNQARFNRVDIFDPHSEVSTALIDHAYPIPNHAFVKDCIQQHLGEQQDFWIISPDGGALKKIHKVAEYLHTTRVGECMKTRDIKTGKLSGFKSMEDDFGNLPCFIVDDICDGGGTFSGVGEVLRQKNAGEIILIISHGIFSKGYTINHIDHIYTTNSFREIDAPEIKVKQILDYLE